MPYPHNFEPNRDGFCKTIIDGRYCHMPESADVHQNVLKHEVKTRFSGMFTIPDENRESCEFCTYMASKCIDFTSFQVNLCDKCVRLVEFILHIVNDNHQYRK